MSKQRLAILITSALGILSIFMPWITIPILGSMDGTKVKFGWMVLALFIVVLISSLLGNRNKSMRGGIFLLAVVPGILAAMAAILQLVIIILGKFVDTGDPLQKAMAPVINGGFGIYLAILAALAIPIFAFIFRDPKPVEPLKSIQKSQNPKKHESTTRLPKTTPPQPPETDDHLEVRTQEKPRRDNEDHSRFMPK